MATNPYFMPIYTAIVGLILGGILARFRTMTSSVKAIRIGVSVLLRGRLEHFYDKYRTSDSIPRDEYQDIKETGAAYHSLNGNSVGDKMLKELEGKKII